MIQMPEGGEYVKFKNYERKLKSPFIISKDFESILVPEDSTEELLKCIVTDLFKINGKQMIQMPEGGEYVKFKNYERKLKSPFIISKDFESILVPEDNEKQHPKDCYMK